MNTFTLFLLTLEGILFLLWAYLMFRMLNGIRRRHAQSTSKPLVGPTAVFGVFGSYLKDQRFRRERLVIVAVFMMFLFTNYLFIAVQSR